MARTGLSHVTIYRIYGHVRRRLYLLSVLLTKGEFIDLINEGESEGLPHFDWTEFTAYLKQGLGQRRGIRAKDKALHEAELIQRFLNHYTPSRLYRLILLSARHVGPLNRPPLPEGMEWATDEVHGMAEFNMRFLSQKSTHPALHPPAEPNAPTKRRPKSKPR